MTRATQQDGKNDMTRVSGILISVFKTIDFKNIFSLSQNF